ncbi:heavy metal-associated isoprenylated plant protein 41-like [Hordeum vulgare subsp. vulgare]|uniref:25S rRNA (uridine-N(3))-methyltransferase BMT5-like domain-containing protein n=1 Tax=Hordeum vulgare subsp. vulgare TaxID=112509 RepID=A0A8I7B9B3_HORVV|nr:heavy metal-associated isoprenylated plant protein 41-like [Hordeum vulgare subsp. vulgare]
MAGASLEGGALNAAAERVGLYWSTQAILLVGEGDFSFALALATGFGSGANLVVTSLDDYGTLTKKYRGAESNLAKLKKMGAVILLGVDAGKLDCHAYLRTKQFDRIVFNFPHAGFSFGWKEDDERLIKEHQKVVKAYFESASRLLCPEGEVHVSHKRKHPYYKWDLLRLAADSDLHLVYQPYFCKEDYPGYNNKRGDGKDCDEPFMLGVCSTFMFRKGYLNMIERPSHSLPVAPMRQGCHPYVLFNMYGMSPGSGFPQYAAAQPGYALENVPRQNSNMAGIIQQDQLSHWRGLIEKFGRHPT